MPKRADDEWATLASVGDAPPAPAERPVIPPRFEYSPFHPQFMARTLLPNVASLLSGEPNPAQEAYHRTPLPEIGKVRSGADQRIPDATAEGLMALTSLVPIGAAGAVPARAAESFVARVGGKMPAPYWAPDAATRFALERRGIFPSEVVGHGPEANALIGRRSSESRTRALAPAEETASVNYQADSRAINKALRESEGKTGADPALDSAIDAGRLPRDMQLFRSIEPGPWTAEIRNLKPGDIYTDHGYLSTSIAATPEQVATGPGLPRWVRGNDRDVLLKIMAPKGSRGLSTTLNGMNAEREVILPRSTSLEFLGRDPRDFTYVFRLAGPKQSTPRPADFMSELRAEPRSVVQAPAVRDPNASKPFLRELEDRIERAVNELGLSRKEALKRFIKGDMQ